MKKRNWLLVGILAIVTFLLGLLANSIMNRSHEAEFIAKGGNNLEDQECRNELYAQFYPRQYDSWEATADTTFQSKWMMICLRNVLKWLCSGLVMLSLRSIMHHVGICMP